MFLFVCCIVYFIKRNDEFRVKTNRYAQTTHCHRYCLSYGVLLSFSTYFWQLLNENIQFLLYLFAVQFYLNNNDEGRLKTNIDAHNAVKSNAYHIFFYFSVSFKQNLNEKHTVVFVIYLLRSKVQNRMTKTEIK